MRDALADSAVARGLHRAPSLTSLCEAVSPARGERGKLGSCMNQKIQRHGILGTSFQKPSTFRWHQSPPSRGRWPCSAGSKGGRDH